MNNLKMSFFYASWINLSFRWVISFLISVLFSSSSHVYPHVVEEYLGHQLPGDAINIPR